MVEATVSRPHRPVFDAPFKGFGRSLECKYHSDTMQDLHHREILRWLKRYLDRLEPLYKGTCKEKTMKA